MDEGVVEEDGGGVIDSHRGEMGDEDIGGLSGLQEVERAVADEDCEAGLVEVFSIVADDFVVCLLELWQCYPSDIDDEESRGGGVLGHCVDFPDAGFPLENVWDD